MTFQQINLHRLILVIALGVLVAMTIGCAKDSPDYDASEKDTSKEKPPETPPENQWKDTVTITIGPGQGKEYKFFVEKGAVLEYSWKTNGEALFYDFHGEPKGDTTGFFESYKKKTEKNSSGTFTAPFDGAHGWFWKNTGPVPVEITLQTKGSYKVLGLR